MGGRGARDDEVIANDYDAINDCMASITKEEARRILRAAVTEKDAKDEDLVRTIRRRFLPFGGVDLRLPEREPIRAWKA